MKNSILNVVIRDHGRWAFRLSLGVAISAP